MKNEELEIVSEAGQSCAHTSLVSYAIFTFNQREYVRDAIESALIQTYSPLEILISDDASSDGTQDVIKEIIANYNGPHQVIANFNPINLGIGRHVSKVIAMAKGELVVMAAGDDQALATRVERIVAHWASTGKRPSALFSRVRCMDHNGNLQGNLAVRIEKPFEHLAELIEYSGKSLLVLGASAAYDVRVLRNFDALLPGVNVEDIPLMIRAGMLNGIKFIDEELVNYRVNTSVWLPRKLRGESFDRHLERLWHRVKTDYQVARQITHDVSRCDNPRLILAAVKRFGATRFIFECCLTGRFSVSDYFRSALFSGYWSRPLFLGAILCMPRVHRLMFKIYQKARR